MTIFILHSKNQNVLGVNAMKTKWKGKKLVNEITMILKPMRRDKYDMRA